ncbi:MAG: hypothetical protein JW963_10030 [Anaerolineales bacterium]|nr:hypothetical protein [Anaerolineales bacterium]
MSSNFKKFAFYLGLVLFLAGVGLFAYLGYFNRDWADDWCYNADFKNLGFLETVAGYAYNVTYTPSRYSVTIFAGLLYAFGTLGTQLMTPLTIIFWVAGLAYLFYNLAGMAGCRLSRWLVVLVSAVIVYFSIYLSPHIYQSLYWRTGMLTYTTPLVFLPWIFVFITEQSKREKPAPIWSAFIFILALLGGGFSEASCTVLVSTLGLYTLLAGIGYRQKKLWAVKTFVPALVALVGSLLGMALLVFAPTTQVRAERYGEPAGLAEMIVLLYQFTYAFFVLSLKDVQNILLILMSVFSGFLFFPSQMKTDKPVRILFLAVLVGILAVFLVAASFAPSAYVERGLPADRTIIIPRFIAVFGFVLAGWLTGFALREMLTVKWLETFVVVLLLVSYAFPLYSLKVTAEKVPVYAQRTREWDARQAAIQEAIANGEERVDVFAIDGLPVGGIRDFDPQGKTGFWITKCAQSYYDINLRVSLP